MLYQSVCVGAKELTVVYLRGKRGEKDGFWVVTVSSGLEGLQFAFSSTIPDARAAADAVIWYDSERNEGVSGRGCDVRALSRDNDTAIFSILARVMVQPASPDPASDADDLPF